ncbi:MAG: response regulator, partial [Ruminococcus sp.]|nr:response regulator [Ruminococcus sp.]
MFNTHERFYSQNGKRQLLIAEDELINREILGNILKTDFDVIFAEDGAQAIKLIEDNAATLSLVLLDLNMPRMSGQQVLKEMKEDPRLKNIPVIVLTADNEAEVESLMLGAVDFIPKPYPETRIILARIIRTIELFEDRELIRSTERDPITGLYTKEYFYKYAEQYDQHHKDKPMDAMVLDINHFHIINDRFGMSFGDEILCKIGERLKESVGSMDGIVCRKESDVFLIYCPHGIDHKELIDNATVELVKDESTNSHVRLRLGVYANVDSSISIEARFDRAKMASDTIRNNLSKNIEFYDDSLREKELYVEQLVDDFRKAIPL